VDGQNVTVLEALCIKWNKVK